MSEPRKHLSVISVLAAGAAALTGIALWVHRITAPLCAEGVARPSHWIYAGLALLALAIVVASFVGVFVTNATLLAAQTYAVVGLGEGATAVIIAFWLAGKYSHYDCP